MTFDGCEINSGSADLARVINLVTSASKANAECIFFLGLECNNNTQVGGFAICWLISVSNEMDGLSAAVHVGTDTLGKASNFIGRGLDPLVTIGATDQLGVFESGASGGINDGVGQPRLGGRSSE